MQIYRYIILALLAITTANIAVAQNTKLSLEQKRKFDYYFYEAMNAKATFKHSEVLDLLNHCYAIDSTNAHVAYEIGTYHKLLKNQEQSKLFLKKAVDYEPSNYYYSIAYADLCLEERQYEDAKNRFLDLIKRYPDKTEIYLYLAETYRRDGDIEGSIGALDKLEQNIGLNEKLSIQKFQLYAMLGQEDKGFSEIQKHIDKNPHDIEPRILLGNLYLQTDRTEKAKEVYDLARKIEPENPYLISSMAEYYEKIGDSESAEKELKVAILSPIMDIETKLGILTQHLATLQQSGKDIKDANHLFTQLMDLHPQESELNIMYGNLLILQEDKDGAYDQFSIYAQAHPSKPLGWEQMLSVSFPDSISKTIYICEQAIKYIPENPQFYFFLGLAHYLEEDYNKALASLNEGLQFVDESNSQLLSDFYGQIGDLRFHMGNTKEAFEAYEQAVRYNPRNLGILNNYSYFLTLARVDLDKAEKMSGLTIEAEPTNPTYLDTYGWVLFEQGAYSFAKLYIEKSIHYTEEEKKEVSAEVLDHYGDVLFMLKDEEKALEYWKKALEKSEKSDDTSILKQKIKTKSFIKKDAKI